MKSIPAILLLLGGALAAGQAARTAPATAGKQSAPPPWTQFKVLVERNIFDPQRRAPTPGGAVAPPPAAPVSERISLNGVLLDQGEGVAFFEGTSPEYNATVKLGGVIAGCRVTAIRTDRVQLALKERQLDLPVATQLFRRPQSDWEVTTDTTPITVGAPSGAPVEGASGSSAGPPAEAGAAPAPAAGGAQSDLIKKLMERRRKEMGQ